MILKKVPGAEVVLTVLWLIVYNVANTKTCLEAGYLCALGKGSVGPKQLLWRMKNILVHKINGASHLFTALISAAEKVIYTN